MKMHYIMELLKEVFNILEVIIKFQGRITPCPLAMYKILVQYC